MLSGPDDLRHHPWVLDLVQTIQEDIERRITARLKYFTLGNKLNLAAPGVIGPGGKPYVPGMTVEDEGAALPPRAALDFVGAGVAATDDQANDRTVVTIPGGLTNPMTAAGDLIDGGVAGAPQRLAAGSAGQVLTVVNGAPFLAAPSAPSLSTAATGGTVAAGTYQAEITYVNAQGETVASAGASITTTGATSTLTVASPPAAGSGSQTATGWYAYVTQAGGSIYTRQQAAGSPTAIGTNLTLTAPPTSTGAAPPASNTAGTLIPGWATSSSGFADPETTAGDLIYRNGANVTDRLPVGSSGQVLTVVSGLPAWSTFAGGGPAGHLGYAQITANQSTTSTTLVDVTGLSVTVTVGSRPIKITCDSWGSLNSGSDLRAGYSLYDVTAGAQVQFAVVTSPGNQQQALCMVAYLTPPAGSRTYKLRFQSLVNGTTTINAAATDPAFILVEEV
ncbi:MAG TPA: hypothetical protein VFL91_00705 [Thermomicrobiales bacterium]|nr:hypothetical protein [Thermomicrobiales bacterium]